jgi:hypothetical protein
MLVLLYPTILTERGYLPFLALDSLIVTIHDGLEPANKRPLANNSERPFALKADVQL